MNTKQSRAEVVMIRFVDFTVQPGRTYQYRIKAAIKNPNRGRADVADEAFKKAKALEGDWSDPSPVVYVPSDIEYYVLERGRTRQEARLEVHRWEPEFGDWHVRKFLTTPGQAVGQLKDHEWVDFNDKLQKGSVDFSTHDLLVDVVGGRREFYFEGIGRMSESLPAEVLLLDRFGNLVTRRQATDKNDPNRVGRVQFLNRLLSDAKAKKRGEVPGSEEGEEDLYDRSPIPRF